MGQKDIIDRLNDYIEFDELVSPTAFAVKAGLDPSGFIKMLKGQLPITPTTLKKISKTYGLSLEWLVDGIGSMYAPRTSESTHPQGNSIIDRIETFLEINSSSTNAFARTAGLDPGNMGKMLAGKQKITDATLRKIADAHGLNFEWLKYGEGEMFNDTDAANASGDAGDTRPRVPYTAAAGTLTSSMEGVFESQCERAPRVRNFPAYDFTIIIRGDSMEPEYQSGDEVACRRIDNTSFVQWGKTHVLDTSQGIVMKRIYNDGDKIRCVSYNKDYPDFSIAKSEVYSMNLVVGVLRLK